MDIQQMYKCHGYTLGGPEPKWRDLTDGPHHKGKDIILDLLYSCLMRTYTIPSIYRWGDLDLKELI
jgi:hypothetical protein